MVDDRMISMVVVVCYNGAVLMGVDGALKILLPSSRKVELRGSGQPACLATCSAIPFELGVPPMVCMERCG